MERIDTATANKPIRGTPASPSHCSRTFTHKDYTVGWVCPLAEELTAALNVLDSRHVNLTKDPFDSNTYVLGSIGPHNIVLASLPSGNDGTVSAAVVVAHMTRTFRHIHKRFMVGIAGGVPGPDEIDLRLGDIVVGERVIQYDRGKIFPRNRLQRTLRETGPPTHLSTAVSTLRGDYESRYMRRDHWEITPHAVEKPSIDQLFDPAYEHEAMSPDCKRCNDSKLVRRSPRAHHGPRVHYGAIASGNSVVKDGVQRDQMARDLSQNHRVLCFEMEAAGLMSDSQCLVIRGISDYADSHKNDQWREYAAASAASYTKELLSVIAGDSPNSFDANNSIKPQGTSNSQLSSMISI